MPKVWLLASLSRFKIIKFNLRFKCDFISRAFKKKSQLQNSNRVNILNWKYKLWLFLNKKLIITWLSHENLAPGQHCHDYFKEEKNQGSDSIQMISSNSSRSLDWLDWKKNRSSQNLVYNDFPEIWVKYVWKKILKQKLKKLFFLKFLFTIFSFSFYDLKWNRFDFAEIFKKQHAIN